MRNIIFIINGVEHVMGDDSAISGWLIPAFTKYVFIPHNNKLRDILIEKDVNKTDRSWKRNKIVDIKPHEKLKQNYSNKDSKLVDSYSYLNLLQDFIIDSWRNKELIEGVDFSFIRTSRTITYEMIKECSLDNTLTKDVIIKVLSNNIGKELVVDCNEIKNQEKIKPQGFDFNDFTGAVGSLINIENVERRMNRKYNNICENHSIILNAKKRFLNLYKDKLYKVDNTYFIYYEWHFSKNIKGSTDYFLNDIKIFNHEITNYDSEQYKEVFKWYHKQKEFKHAFKECLTTELNWVLNEPAKKH